MTKLAIHNNDDTEALPDKRPILLAGGELEQNLDEIEQALLEQRVGVFQRNGGLVRPGTVSTDVQDGTTIPTLGLIPVCAEAMIEIITSAARLGKYDGRARRVVPTNCPPQIASAFMKRQGHWGLRPLTGTATAPTLRPDGSLLTQPGYDAATGLLYTPQPGVVFPPIPEHPSRAEALVALAVLDELICEYRFVSPAARSVALAAILTGVIRRMLPTAPGIGITSPVYASGKGLLCNTISYLTHGRIPSSLTQGNEEETEKRVSSALMRGDLVICIDNILEPVGGAKIFSILTEQVADLRPLGSSKLVGHDTRSLFLFNGNNLVIAADMCRRILMCEIDPETEHPERRTFGFNPLQRAQQDRGRYVMAALTILRAYQADPVAPFLIQGSALGSYEEWVYWVRDALLWLDQADPTLTVDQSKSLDPVAERIGAVIHHWGEVIGEGTRITVKDAIAKADYAVSNAKGSGLRDAFNAVAAPFVRGAGEHVDSLRLGKWLGKNKNRIIAGRRIQRVPEKLDGNTQWVLERVEGQVG